MIVVGESFLVWGMSEGYREKKVVFRSGRVSSCKTPDPMPKPIVIGFNQIIPD